jgi:hypothetical protein
MSCTSEEFVASTLRVANKPRKNEKKQTARKNNLNIIITFTAVITNSSVVYIFIAVYHQFTEHHIIGLPPLLRIQMVSGSNFLRKPDTLKEDL